MQLAARYDFIWFRVFNVIISWRSFNLLHDPELSSFWSVICLSNNGMTRHPTHVITSTEVFPSPTLVGPKTSAAQIEKRQIFLLSPIVSGKYEPECPWNCDQLGKISCNLQWKILGDIINLVEVKLMVRFGHPSSWFLDLILPPWSVLFSRCSILYLEEMISVQCSST